MHLIKRNDRGQEVKALQTKLNKILVTNLVIDGHFGVKTEEAVRQMQSKLKLVTTGMVSKHTMKLINEVYNNVSPSKTNGFGFDPKFVVFVDAAHGGVDDKAEYTTPGKRAYHEGHKLHQGGHYYEGYESRIVAERFIQLCTAVNIETVRTYHPYKDTSLSERTELVQAYLKRGYFGYLHSIHSNAISDTNSKEKLEATRGFISFNTRGNNFSDEISSRHWFHVSKIEGMELRSDKKDGDVDYEANFQILRETDLSEFERFGAILDEWDFHTSAAGCENIIRTREQRAQAMLLTAQWVKNQLTTK